MGLLSRLSALVALPAAFALSLLAAGCAGEEATESDADLSDVSAASTRVRPATPRGPCSVLVVMSDESTLHAVGTAAPIRRDYEFGFLLDEMAIPVRALLDSGCKVTFTNPSGVEPPRDRSGDKAIYFTDGVPEKTQLRGKSPVQVVAALAAVVPGRRAHAELLSALDLVESETSPIRGHGLGSFDTPIPFADFIAEDGVANGEKLASFDAVFVPGGYAPMLNLWNDRALGAMLRWFHDQQRTTVTLCRGGVALRSTAEVGAFAYRGYRMTTYSTLEDDVASVIGKVLPLFDLPFHPNQKLKDVGALVEFSEFHAFVVEDRELISGENQWSAHLLADHFLTRLGR